MITEKMKWFLEQNNIDHSQMDYATASKAIKAIKEGKKLEPHRAVGEGSNPSGEIRGVRLHNSHDTHPQAGASVTSPPSSTPVLSKDTLIVRQSCLKAAVELFNEGKIPTENVKNGIDIIKSIAEEFEKWVFR